MPELQQTTAGVGAPSQPHTAAGVGNRATFGWEKYGLERICCTSCINEVLIDWTRDFGDWLDQVTERADRGDRHSQLMLELVTAELSVLQDLTFYRT